MSKSISKSSKREPGPGSYVVDKPLGRQGGYMGLFYASVIKAPENKDLGPGSYDVLEKTVKKRPFSAGTFGSAKR